MKKTIILFFLVLGLSINSNAQAWAQLPDFPGLERDDGVAFVINNKAYCGTGLQVGWVLANDFYCLNLTTETWTPMASMPAGKERQYACGFTDGTSGFVFGGEASGTDLNDLWMYSPTSNSWTAMASKPGNGVRGASCFVVGNFAYIIGGAYGSIDALSEVWAYDMVLNTWAQKNNLPITNWRGSGAAIGNVRGYLLFGMDVNYSLNRYLYEYDPGTDSWYYKNTFAGPGTGKVYANMQTINNNLVVFAGKDSLNACNNELWAYNLLSNSWLAVSTLTATLRKGGMGFTNANTYYYTCGISQADVRLKETWKTDLSVGIKEFEKKGKIMVYPNPAFDLITIRFPDPASKNLNYKILDSKGAVVLNGIFNENNQIEVKTLTQGIYQLLIANYTSRIIIQ